MTPEQAQEQQRNRIEDRSSVRQKLEVRSYEDGRERQAFVCGFHDGFTGKNKRRTNFPNAYAAGYWEGVADKEAENA